MNVGGETETTDTTGGGGTIAGMKRSEVFGTRFAKEGDEESLQTLLGSVVSGLIVKPGETEAELGSDG